MCSHQISLKFDYIWTYDDHSTIRNGLKFVFGLIDVKIFISS